MSLHHRFKGIAAVTRMAIFAALATTGAGAATVFTSISTDFSPNNGPAGGVVSTGGPDLPVYVPVGISYISLLTFTDSAGGVPQSISWQLQRPLTDPGPVPVASDFRVWQQTDGSAVSAGPVSITFDGIDTYTFTVQSPTASYRPANGSVIYVYFLAPRYRDRLDDLPANAESIMNRWQAFQLVAVPEPGSAVLCGLGCLLLARRRR